MCVPTPLSPGDLCRSTKRTCCSARAIGRFFVPGADGASGFPFLLLRPQPPSALSPLASRSHMSPATLTRPTHTSLSARHQVHLSHLFVCVCVCLIKYFYYCFFFLKSLLNFVCRCVSGVRQSQKFSSENTLLTEKKEQLVLQSSPSDAQKMEN